MSVTFPIGIIATLRVMRPVVKSIRFEVTTK
jgi:hypothetical protein